jgi:hypothetical protein
MTEQPTALRLADELEATHYYEDLHEEVAAELRRLHAKLTESEKWRDRDEARAANAERERDISEAQRDALLDACKAYDQWADKTFCYDRELRPIRAQIRAAIAKAEENT